MGKEHNCSNFGGSEGCSACMDDLRAELAQANLQAHDWEQERDKYRAEAMELRVKVQLTDLQNSEMRKALEQYVNVFLPGGISPANDLFKPGGLLHEGSDVCGKSLKREGQS